MWVLKLVGKGLKFGAECALDSLGRKLATIFNRERPAPQVKKP
jgi:hypothetical protein